MYRAACTYGRVLTPRHVTSLVAPRVVTCTRAFAKAAAKATAKDPKKDAEPKVKKPRVKKTKTPIDDSQPRLHRQLNVHNNDATLPSITREQLQELIKSGEKFVLVDLRTEAEILLSGDALIPAASRMPIQPLTHLDTFKPPKVKVDKTAKGKKGKKNPKQNAKKQAGKPEPEKKDPQQRDIFVGCYRMTPAMWEAKYRFPKIDFEDNVVFLSSSNVRSSAVVSSAMRLGYKNVKFLEGGSRVWNKYYNILGQ